jgi:hypothetical protein
MTAYEPFVFFLTDPDKRPCPPLAGERPPINCVGLFELSTRRLPRVKAGYTAPFVIAGLYTERDYWVRRCRFDGMLREWVKSPQAFRCPDRWPVETAEIFPPWLTPMVFSAHVMPHSYAMAHRSPLHFIEGIRELCAYAMGWPIPESQHARLARGAISLMEEPTFVIWAYHLDLDGVPLPFNSRPLHQRLKHRADLEENPLACGRGIVKGALPAGLHETQNLLRMCPRKSDLVGPSRRRPMISNDEVFSLPSHLTPAEV